MSKNEENIISKLTIIIPKMSEFNKGYLLGMIETLAYDKPKEEVKATKIW